jgi:hypothetical protein
MLGYDGEDFQTDLNNWLTHIHPDDVDALKEQFALPGGRRATRHGVPAAEQERGLDMDGGGRRNRQMGHCASPLRMIGIHTDITERKQSLTEQKRLNRALRLVSECNLALVRNDNEIQLLNDVCQLIVSTGGYRMAWVGYAEDDGQRASARSPRQDAATTT